MNHPYLHTHLTLPQVKIQLTGAQISTDAAGRTLFRTARIGDAELSLGQVREGFSFDPVWGKISPWDRCENDWMRAG